MRLTIRYESGDDGFVVASIPDVPGAHSQGRNREEARANVVDALRELLIARSELAEAQADKADLDSLELIFAE